MDFLDYSNYGMELLLIQELIGYLKSSLWELYFGALGRLHQRTDRVFNVSTSKAAFGTQDHGLLKLLVQIVFSRTSLGSSIYSIRLLFMITRF